MSRSSLLGAIGLMLAACASAAPAPDDAHAASQNGAAATRPVPPADLDARLIEYYPLRGRVLSESGFARVSFTVAPNGAVTTASEALKANHPAYAAACRSMLEASTWTPARDAAGRAAPYTGTFDCAFEHASSPASRTTVDASMNPQQNKDGEDWFEVNPKAPHKELALADVGAAGPLAVEGVATALEDHLPAFTHCFESAFSMSKKVHGKHWLAFEIGPTGAVGRVEWVERVLADEMLESCVFSALRALRFPAATASTLADVQLEAGGVARITHTL